MKRCAQARGSATSSPLERRASRGSTRRRRQQWGLYSWRWPLSNMCLMALTCLGYVASDFVSEGSSTPLTLADLYNAPGMTVGSNPSMVILGTAKGGTTDLHTYILKTYGEYINMPVRKELAMLSKKPSKFDVAAYQRLLNQAGPCPFSVDSTPGYINYGTRVLANIAKVTNQANMIMMLREPVSRTRSLFNHWYITGTSPFGEMTFAEAMDFEFDIIHTRGADAYARLLSSEDDWKKQVIAFEELCQHFKDAAHEARMPFSQSVLLKGIYSQSVMLYADGAFVRGKALIMQSEHYYSNVERTLYDVVTPFLFNNATYPETHKAKWRFDVTAGTHTSYVELSAMAPELGCKLQRFFEPFVRRTLAVLASPAVTTKAFVLPPVTGEGADPTSWWRSKDYCAGVYQAGR